MKTKLFAFTLLLAASLVAGPVRPVLETTIKGSAGSEIKFTILAVWADGFHVRQPGGKPNLFIPWEKVDLAWLATDRPDIDKLRATAQPFPKLSAAEAQQKLDEAKKLFRAKKLITYTITKADLTSETRSVPNAIADKYATKVRSLTPANLTQGLNQIAVDVERDVETMKDLSGRADQIQRAWLTASFVRFLAQMEKVQREIDPVCAGDVKLPNVTPSTVAGKAAENDWF